MKIGYFPGCSLHGLSREYEESLKAIVAGLDTELVEVDDWSCCGASSAHGSSHLLGVALPARNLAIAEEQGLPEVLAPCAACYARLASARHEISEDPQLAGRVNNVLVRDFKNTVRVRSILEVLKGQIAGIKARATNPLKDLKVACYYGCLLVRPVQVTGGYDDPEDPSSMEDICKAAGAVPVKWNRRLDCCGGGLSMSRTGSVVRLSAAILKDAKAAGADAVVVACPMCHSNLDFRQKAMKHRGAWEGDMPVLFLTQVVGMSMGIDPKTLGMGRHFVSTDSVLARTAGTGSGSGTGTNSAAAVAGEVG
jgi:heterodisulfide reductase subunit B